MGRAVIAGQIHLYAGDVGDGSNRYFFASSIPPALAAVLALAVTAILVATQLAAVSFTFRAINYRLRDPWLWGVLALYLSAIIAALATMAQAKAARDHPSWDGRIVDVTILLTAAALLYLVPFTAAALRSLETVSFLRRMLKEPDFGALEDFGRKAVNEGLVRQLQTTMNMLLQPAMDKIELKRGAALEARQFANFAQRLGKYAAAEKDPEAIIVANDYLAAMTTYCANRLYRGAADVFNESVIELRTAAQEAFSSMGGMNSTLAELSERTADSFVSIAEVTIRSREENLRRAIAACDSALKFFAADTHRLRKAHIQNKRGMAFTIEYHIIY